MATKFEDLVNGMINVGFGAAAVAAERSKEVLDDLSAKGEEARANTETPDFARSVFDIFERAGGTVSDTVERLNAQGATAAEKVLDELILARARQLSEAERAEFVAHVQQLVEAIQDEPVSVPVESVESVDAEAATEAKGE